MSGSDKDDASDDESISNANTTESMHEGDSLQLSEIDTQPQPSTWKKSESAEKPAKKKKRGIIYLSTLPKHMTVAIAREMFGQYADVGRVFFQPSTKPDDDVKKKTKKRRPFSRHFTEGWIEFESKRAAKQIAVRLNNTAIATRKSSKFYDILWSIKYLPRFKWAHLSERLTYEKAVYKQKLRVEISQARREASFFQENLDKSDKNKRLKKKDAKLNKKN